MAVQLSKFPEENYKVIYESEKCQAVSFFIKGIGSGSHRTVKYQHEKIHQHIGGILCRIPSPLTVYNDKDEQTCATAEKGDKLVPLFLQPSDLHYTIPDEDYHAIFLEIPEESLSKESLEWETRPQQSFVEKVWVVDLSRENHLSASRCHRFVISHSPLKISHNEKIVEDKKNEQSPFSSYYLEPMIRYKFSTDEPTSFIVAQYGRC